MYQHGLSMPRGQRAYRTNPQENFHAVHLESNDVWPDHLIQSELQAAPRLDDLKKEHPSSKYCSPYYQDYATHDNSPTFSGEYANESMTSNYRIPRTSLITPPDYAHPTPANLNDLNDERLVFPIHTTPSILTNFPEPRLEFNQNISGPSSRYYHEPQLSPGLSSYSPSTPGSTSSLSGAFSLATDTIVKSTKNPADDALQAMGDERHDIPTKKKNKMHQCSICLKWFPRPSGLKTHMNSHDKLTPFSCEIDGCSRSFSVQSNARRHLQKAHGIMRKSASGSAYNVGFQTPTVATTDPLFDVAQTLVWLPQNQATPHKAAIAPVTSNHQHG